MLTNDILRRVRYALNLNDTRVIEIFGLTNYTLPQQEIDSLFSKEDDDNFMPCSDEMAHRFFSGLILALRGPQEGGKSEPSRKDILTGNDVLWYIRIALQLRDDDILKALKEGGMVVSKGELSSLFRKKGQPNFRPCGDQLLRKFLAGLTATRRA